MTILAPAARHFLVQASAPALAPFAPHLSSATHPFTVALFPMSSNAIADRASTKQNARQISSTFLMAGFSPLSVEAATACRGLKIIALFPAIQTWEKINEPAGTNLSPHV